MQTAIQVGERQLPVHKILQHLTTSPFLAQYLRLLVIDETLAEWHESTEYQLSYSETELAELYHQVALLNLSSEDSHQIQAVKKTLSLQKYQQVSWGHKVSSHFLARKSQLDRVIFSAIQVDNRGMAQEIYLRIKDRKQSFDKLARLYSQGAEAKFGGVIGPILVDRVHPYIAYRLTGLESGDLSPIFQLDNFHVFIRLEQRLPARFDDEMKAQLMEELFEQWLQAEITNRMSSLELAILPPDAQLAQDLLSATQPLAAITETPDFQTQLAQSEVQIIDGDDHIIPDLDRPLAPLQIASSSFFAPLSEAESESTTAFSHPTPSSFFAPQPTPTQIINRQHHRNYQLLFQQVIAFFIFFSLFLSGGFGTVYLLNLLVGNTGIQTRHQ